MMKKLLAMLMAVLMLISACAMAEAASGGHLIIRDVEIDLGGGETLDLSGVDLTLALAGDDSQGALRVAVDAAGASVLNAIAALGQEELTLRADGISDVYSIRYEDLIAMIQEAAGDVDVSEAFKSGFDAGFAAGASGEVPAEVTALCEHAVEIFSGALTPAGTETIDGVDYEVYDLAVSEEQMAVLVDDLAVLLDAYGQGGLEGSGYDSYRQMFDEVNLRLSADGVVKSSETNIITSIDVTAFGADEAEPATLNIYVDVTEDPENETEEIYLSLSTVEDGESEEILSAVATYTEVNGEFGEFDLDVYGPDSNDARFYVSVSSPVSQAAGLWEFDLSVEEDGSETMGFYLDFGSVNGQDEFYAHLTADGQTFYIDYEGADGVGRLSIGMMGGDQSMGGVSATVEVGEDDGAWLPGAADATVDILTIDEAQLEKLSNEGMMLLMNAMSALSQANESLAEMLGGM